MELVAGAPELGEGPAIVILSEAKNLELPVSDYFVYIMTNNSGTLYVGVTNNLERRVSEHKRGDARSFTQRYKATRLVYYESTPDVRSALEREKQIKGWLRRRKIALIRSPNPHWTDLSATFSGEIETLRSAQGDSLR